MSQKNKFSNLEAQRDMYKQKADDAIAERDKYLQKLDVSEKELVNLEEQLASLSAALQGKGEVIEGTENADLLNSNIVPSAQTLTDPAGGKPEE